MASANGFSLNVTTRSAGKFTLTAAWAAPYFVLVDNTNFADEKPLLYHAESLADAHRFARIGDGGKTVILNADFTEWKPQVELRMAA